MTPSPSASADPSLQRVFDYVDAHREAFLQRLVAYLRIPGISAHGTGIAETADHIAGVLRAIGLEPRLMATAGWGNVPDAAHPHADDGKPSAGWPVVYAESRHAPGAPTVLLYGHYDVQPPDPLDQWLSPPFEPTIRAGRLYARGAGDNKGQHFAQLLALESLLAVAGALPCNVKVLLEGEEEIGSPRMAGFVRAHRAELAADLVITSDGPVHESGRSQLVCGVRGVLSFELRARGANRDLHSGNWGGVAPNPIWTLVHLLASMKNARGEVTIDGFYDAVLPQTPLEREALAQLPLDAERIQRELELREFDQPVERAFFDRLSAWPTFTVNGFHSGYGGPGSKTVLPHEAVAKCDIRLVEAQQAADIFAKLVAHVQRHAPGIVVVHQGAMEPSKTPLDSPFVARLLRAITLAQGEPPLLVPALGGSLPDYVWTKILGVPAFVVPYANADESNHAPNENIEVERFYKGIKTGAAMLTLLGALAAGSGARHPRGDE